MTLNVTWYAYAMLCGSQLVPYLPLHLVTVMYEVMSRY